MSLFTYQSKEKRQKNLSPTRNRTYLTELNAIYPQQVKKPVSFHFPFQNSHFKFWSFPTSDSSIWSHQQVHTKKYFNIHIHTSRLKDDLEGFLIEKYVLSYGFDRKQGFARTIQRKKWFHSKNRFKAPLSLYSTRFRAKNSHDSQQKFIRFIAKIQIFHSKKTVCFRAKNLFVSEQKVICFIAKNVTSLNKNMIYSGQIIQNLTGSPYSNTFDCLFRWNDVETSGKSIEISENLV